MINSPISSRPSINFYLGLVTALAVSLILLSWKTAETARITYVPLDDEEMIINIDMAEVNILPDRPIPPSAAAPSKDRPARITPSTSPRPVPISMEMKASTMQTTPLSRKSVPQRSIAPRTSRENTRSMEELQAHEMPYFRSCGSIKDPIERFQCTQIELRSQIAQRFRVPSVSQVGEIPARVDVTFVIDSYGKFREIESEDTIDEDLKEEIERVFGGMPEMVPATAAGERLSVRFRIPFSIIRLER